MSAATGVPAHVRWSAAAAPGVHPPTPTLTDAFVESLARSVPRRRRPRPQRVALAAPPAVRHEPECPGERLLTFTDAEFARRLALEAIAVRIERLRGDQSEIRTHRRRLSHAGITASCPMCERVLTRSALLAVLDAIESQLATLEVDLSYFEQRREQLRGTT